jgi:hypothetical protein
VIGTRGEDLPVCLIGERLVFVVPYLVSLQVNGCGLWIAIPEGYSWDGASIPRACWSIMGHPLEADLRLASLVHDWHCEHATDEAERMVGDALFLLLLRQAGLPRWRRLAMWAAVRLYAVFFWRVKRGQTGG